jgi:hypothetical protein
MVVCTDVPNYNLMIVILKAKDKAIAGDQYLAGKILENSEITWDILESHSEY